MFIRTQDATEASKENNTALVPTVEETVTEAKTCWSGPGTRLQATEVDELQLVLRHPVDRTVVDTVASATPKLMPLTVTVLPCDKSLLRGAI
jgi:hypothetical protein